MIRLLALWLVLQGTPQIRINDSKTWVIDNYLLYMQIEPAQQYKYEGIVKFDYPDSFSMEKKLHLTVNYCRVHFPESNAIIIPSLGVDSVVVIHLGR
jgi:hypothetical protein